ncbi:dipeptidase [Phenylobacterium sp.]|uniref:dipeptidase n=1 Tax=Phenylobacterium sp. TaxID=1871053 RepID=UPI001220C387|nr:dipeptidase [Phenylobacterium sp.]THD60389.1 MAG: membrane dipeptidase [Phenylobacterium sp.]
MRIITIAAVASGLALAASGALAAPQSDAEIQARVARVLKATPLIDGHNDFPWEVRDRFAQKTGVFDMKSDLSHQPPVPGGEGTGGLMTDIPRLHAGGVGGQFWSVYIPVAITGPAAVQTTIEQIDIVKRLAARYPADLGMAYTADDIVRLHKEGRIASLIGVEGGHQIDDSMAVLRAYYALGARYMTLAHFTDNHFADSATDDPLHHGLSPYGKAVVGEMNRLGMLVDLSHVSAETMRDALAVSQAPVIFSHSGARAISDHPRNVPDDVLALVAKNHGVVMANFATGYVSDARRRWNADQAAETAREASLFTGQPDRRKAAMAEWAAAHPKPRVTLAQVADHIEQIRKACGIDCVGLGSDFDGIPDTPEGLEGVDKYPALLAELARRGWSDEDLGKLAGGNLLRVLRDTESTARRLQASEQPSEATIAELDGPAKP